MQTKQIQFDRIRRLESGQFVLECNVNAEKEIKRLLCVSSDVGDVRAVVTAKQIAVSGKVGVKVVYESEDGVDSADYVTDFSKLLADESVTENTKVIVKAEVVDTETELRGQSVAIRTVVGLYPVAVDPDEIEALDCADGVCEKKREIYLTREVKDIDSPVEASEKYSVGSDVEKVLCYSADAVVCKQTALENGLQIDGEICARVVYAADGEICHKTFSMPFSTTVEAPENSTAIVVATVTESTLNVGGKEGDAVLTLTVGAVLRGYAMQSFTEEVSTDVYSPCNQLDFSCPCFSFDEIVNTGAYRERIVGSVIVAEGEQDAAHVLCSEIAECNLVAAYAKDGEIVTEGVLTACVVYDNEDGSKNSVKVELPYALTHEARGAKEGDSVLACVGCCDLFAKIKRGREIEVGATLAFATVIVRTERVPVVTSAEVGEKLPDDGEAIVVVSAKKGETSWDIAKRLCVASDVVESGNSSVTFPTEGGEKIVVYRMLAM